ncbi:cbb3-type cytochrome oxidase assembly protein CcoS [Arsukibacterium sp.]|uniref:cbb3-type cytochrome oxidase assembly protein CcoS n=1 Tax=Arsukibacterium sp. TaxID=1977258 RepID=UPI002FDB9137
MSIIYVLIPIAVLFVLIGLAIFFWAVRSKQFEDLDKEGFSILFDEPEQKPTAATTKQPDDTNPK